MLKMFSVVFISPDRSNIRNFLWFVALAKALIVLSNVLAN